MRSPREGARRSTPPTGLASFRANSNRLLNVVLDTLGNAKAENVVSIDLSGKTSIGDQMVHRLGTLAAPCRRRRRPPRQERLKDEGHGRARVEGCRNAIGC